MTSMTWWQAAALSAATGRRVRRAGSLDWFDRDRFIWHVLPEGEDRRIVQADDFSMADFLASDWTDEEPEEINPCLNSIPPRVPSRIHLDVSAACGDPNPVVRAVVGLLDISAGDAWSVQLMGGGAAAPLSLTAETLSQTVVIPPPDGGWKPGWVYSIRALFEGVGAFPGITMTRTVLVEVPYCDSYSFCGYTSIATYQSDKGFPTADSGHAWVSASGGWVVPTAGDIIDHGGGELGRTGSGDIGSGWLADQCDVIFPIVRRDFSIRYQYKTTSGGKHFVSLYPSTSGKTSRIGFGTWGPGGGSTASYLIVDTTYGAECVREHPAAEWAGLPQTNGQWRTRRIRKSGTSLTLWDGEVGPLELTRPWVPVRGYVALTLGPGVRVKNIEIW